ncbi:MAG: multidrug effflux MFS transporter [Proteobacteria bacterium]|nr:multidrug effflux MFS transporter [Pseudomonadota bacterium]
MADRQPVTDSPATPGLIGLLTGLVMLGQMSTSLYIPSLPSLTDALAADPAEVKLTMTGFLAAFALGQLIFGPISDRFGRRPVLLAGIMVYILGSLGCAAASSLPELIGARLVQGAGACAGATIARAIVRDRFNRVESTRVLAFIAIAMAVGPAFGPIAGGLLQVWFGWRAGFVVLTAFGIVVMLTITARLDESLKRRDATATSPARLVQNYAVLLTDRNFVAYLVLAGCCFGTLFAYATGLPFIFIEILGVSPDLFGFVFLFTVAGYLSGSLVASRAAGRVSGARIVTCGVVLTLVGGGSLLGFVLLGIVSGPTIMGPLMIYMTGFALIIPNAFAGALVPFPTMAGTASAVLGCGQMGIAALGTAGVAALYDGTALPLVGVIFAFAVIGAASFWGLVREPS